MDKLVIIGGGISGLSAGILAQKQGYQTLILEKNKMAGGECTGWNRQGYHIDNCIHWLVGCKQESALYHLWRELGVLTADDNIYYEPVFYTLQTDGQQLSFDRNLEKSRAAFLSAAPEDAQEINFFFDSVRQLECIQPPCEKSPAHMNAFQFLKMALEMKGASKAYQIYGKMTIAELAERFHHPLMKLMMSAFFPKDFLAITLLTSYAFYTSGSAGIPLGGSVGMVRRMREQYQRLGGTLEYNAAVTAADIEEQSLYRLRLDNNQAVTGDAFIWAADPHQLFYKILSEKYLDKNLKTMYENPKSYMANTGYQAAFGILGEDELQLPKGSVVFPCDPYPVSGKSQNLCGIRLYDYDESLFPADKRVIQCNVLLNNEDFAYWDSLSKQAYETEKEVLTETLRQRIEDHFPSLKGQLVLLNTYSPLTFARWCHAHQGAYMSFNPRKGYKPLYVKSTIKGLENLFLASQWIQTSGGLPIAAASGKFALQELMKRFPSS